MITGSVPDAVPPPGHCRPPRTRAGAVRLTLWKMMLIGLVVALLVGGAQAVLSVQVFDLWYATMDHRPTFGGGEQWMYLGFILVVEPMNLLVLVLLFGVLIPLAWQDRTVPFRTGLWLAWSVLPVGLAFLVLVGGPPALILPLLAVELVPLAAAMALVLSRLNRRLA